MRYLPKKKIETEELEDISQEDILLIKPLSE